MSAERKTAAQYSIEWAQQRIHKNAADLRRLADSFDRAADALSTVPSPGRQRAAEVAGDIIHEHAVWLMNAGLHTAVKYAAEADMYRAEETREPDPRPSNPDPTGALADMCSQLPGCHDGEHSASCEADIYAKANGRDVR